MTTAIPPKAKVEIHGELARKMARAARQRLIETAKHIDAAELDGEKWRRCMAAIDSANDLIEELGR